MALELEPVREILARCYGDMPPADFDALVQSAFESVPEREGKLVVVSYHGPHWQDVAKELAALQQLGMLPMLVLRDDVSCTEDSVLANRCGQLAERLQRIGASAEALVASGARPVVLARQLCGFAFTTGVGGHALVASCRAGDIPVVPALGLDRHNLLRVDPDWVAYKIATDETVVSALGGPMIVFVGSAVAREDGSRIDVLTPLALRILLSNGQIPEMLVDTANKAYTAALNGAEVHIIPDGGLFREFYSQDGIGTTISAEPR
ncbi:MAG: hypothetical protein ACR2RB_06065 [Gammaproteobacteria bacterium]